MPINPHLHIAPPDGDGEPLVLVHGGWTDHTTFDAIAGPLAGSFRLIRYDRRGHTLSRDARAGAPTPRRTDEDDLAAIVEALAPGGAHLFGTSYGASIVLALAARRPELVRSVVAHEPPLMSLTPDPEVEALFASVQAQIAAGDAAGWHPALLRGRRARAGRLGPGARVAARGGDRQRPDVRRPRGDRRRGRDRPRRRSRATPDRSSSPTATRAPRGCRAPRRPWPRGPAATCG